MKRTLSFMLVLLMLVSLAACGGAPGGETASATATDAAADAGVPATGDPMAAEYEQMRQTAKTVLAAAANGRADDGVNFTSLIAEGRALLEKYDSLPEEGRAQVDVTGVEEALQKLESLGDEAQAAAGRYVKAFLTLHQGEDLTLTGIFCIKTVLRGDTKYLFALTCQDADGKTRSYYAQSYVSADVTAEAFAAVAQTMYASAPATDDDDAVKKGNVTLSLEAVLAAAKA